MTAEEFLKETLGDVYKGNAPIEHYMIEFAKMHVTQALNQASESVDYELTYYYSSERNAFDKIEESILTAYPLENIK